MLLDDVVLHDGLLKSMTVDYSSKIVIICVEFFEKDTDKERISASIFFEGVESISQVANFDALNAHAYAGNINDWAPSKEIGTTYIDIAGGGIMIVAHKVRLNRRNV